MIAARKGFGFVVEGYLEYAWFCWKVDVLEVVLNEDGEVKADGGCRERVEILRTPLLLVMEAWTAPARTWLRRRTQFAHTYRAGINRVENCILRVFKSDSESHSSAIRRLVSLRDVDTAMLFSFQISDSKPTGTSMIDMSWSAHQLHGAMKVERDGLPCSWGHPGQGYPPQHHEVPRSFLLAKSTSITRHTRAGFTVP